jgi:uncharacterized membrane protein
MALDRPISRIQRAQQAMQSAQQLASSRVPPRIQLFRFGRHLAAVPSAAQLRPRDDATDLQTALRQLPSRLSGETPQALVVFSDGAAQPIQDLPELAAGYRDLGLPVHVLPTGNTGIVGDVAVDQLIVPRRASPGLKVPVRVSLRQTGFDQARVVVQIRSAVRNSAPPLVSLPVTLSSRVQTCELLVDVDPDLGDLLLEVPTLQGEAVVENNRVPFRLSARDRKVRVLYMEGSGGTEYRWIRDAVQEDPDIQCLAMVVHHQYAARPRLQRVDDRYRGFPPTREELFQYDVVICSDISQGAFTPEQIQWTVELVAERGGGFAMVGGHTSFGSGGWDQTAWDKLIPFDMTGRRDYLNVTFRVRIPPDVLTHPIWRIVDDPEQNRRALQAMPPFYGTNLIARVKPAATLLGETDQPLRSAGQMPVFGCEVFGRGRTFAMATDSTYAWGTDFERRWGEGDNRYFRKFWRNVVRWLSENSQAGSRRLEVETDKIIYRPGEAVRVTARAFDETMEETTAYEVTASWANAEERTSAVARATVPLEPDEAEQVYRGEINVPPNAALTGDPDGADAILRAAQLEVAAAEADGEIARTTLDIQLLDDSVELLDPRPAPENLQVLAELSGGRVLQRPSDLADLLRDLQTSEGEVLVHQTPLWDRSYLWLLLVGFLATEWSLRRRAGFG